MRDSQFPRLTRLPRVGLLALAAAAAPLAAPLAVPLAAQGAPSTLAEALRDADRAAFANRRATAAHDEARRRADLPLRGVLPSARVESGVVRTTDPIGAFGTLLRQRGVTPAAFDPARLNDPAAVTNVQGGLVAEVPLLNVDALMGRRAARLAADAVGSSAAWTAVDTRAQVVRGWYGAVMAAAKVATLTDAQRAAEAAVRQVEALVRQGLVTRADALQARVRAGDIAASLLGAQHEAALAARQLGLLIGATDGRSVTVPAALPDETRLRALAVADTSTSTASAATAARLDVRAATLGAEAARTDVQRAHGTALPRVNSFARYDWNAPTALFGGKPNWTIGVMGSWSLPGNPADRAEVAMAQARARSAASDAAGAAASAQLEVAAARGALTVALARLDLTLLSAQEAREAQRLVEKRYVGGLATIAERIGADATATAAALAATGARYALIDALVEWRRVTGGDPGALTVLDATPTAHDLPSTSGVTR
ncbi:MAG: TolC family protein [Gemmatimonadetes bacterium]|nr:TolC family protein [Gemmatimonadota bacterium]